MPQGNKLVLRTEKYYLSDDPHTGADRHAVEQVNNVLIEKSDASGGHRFANRFPLRRAMQPIQRIAAIGIEIKRPGAQRVFYPHRACRSGIFQAQATGRSFLTVESSAAIGPCVRSRRHRSIQILLFRHRCHIEPLRHGSIHNRHGDCGDRPEWSLSPYRCD